MDKKKDIDKGLRTRRQFLKVAGIGGLSAASLYLLGCAAKETTTTKTVTTTVTGAGVTTTVTAPGTTATVTTGPGTTSTVTAPGVTTTVTAIAEETEIAWDKEVDVVVVGTGTVIPAALVAHDAGLKVLMLDKAPEVGVESKFDSHGFGGHTVMSGGGLFIVNNYLIKAAKGEWDRGKAISYIRETAAEQSNDELIAAFVDNGYKMVDWLRDNAGYTWQIGYYGSPPDAPAHTYYYPFEGPNPDWTQLVIVSRPDEVGMGAGLIKHGREAIDARGIEVMFETPAKRLVYRGNSGTGDGEVIGIIAEDPNGQEIAIKARYGVCLGTGGFEHNPEMMRHYLRAPLYASCSAPTNTGDGHLMCMAVGADLRNMNSVWANDAYLPERDPSDLRLSPSTFLPRGTAGARKRGAGTILVNRHGDRVGNEAAPYAVFGRSFNAWDSGEHTWMNIPAFSIFDSGYTSRYTLPGQSGSDREAGVVPEWIKQANSLSGLAAALGIDSERLAATVEYFNRYARNGSDPLFHRGEYVTYDWWTSGDVARYEAGDIPNPCLAPLETPPYYGAALYPSTMGGTNGGPLTNGNAQVKNVWGKVIPRLYASGNCMASAMGTGYAHGGATLGPGHTFAWLAGMHVSTLAPWE